MKYFHTLETIMLVMYKVILEFYFMPYYFKTYGYLFFFTDAGYEFSIFKWVFSNIIFIIFLFFLYKTHSVEKEMQSFLLRIFLLIAVIPALSTYAFISSVDVEYVIYPTIFYLILFVLIKRRSAKFKEKKEIIKFPIISNIDLFMLIFCGLIIIIIWIFMGRPVITTFDDAVEQRISLRAEAMPKIMGYLHTFLGGVVFPYLFATYIDKKKYVAAIISLVLGYLAFSINGMKTWIFLYALYLLVLIVKRLDKGKFELRCIYSEFTCIAILLCCCWVYVFFDVPGFIAQFGRVIIVPSTIGYKSIQFLKTNELLYLRESILRYFFSSPYLNGLDYYIYYGASSTLTSGRSNSGLWSDAYRNFGLLGILVYPFMVEKVFNLLDMNAKRISETLKIFIIIMMLWNGINISFFTWLLTGGVIVIIILEKIENRNTEKSKKNGT